MRGGRGSRRTLVARPLSSRSGRPRRPAAACREGESGALAITHLHRRGTVLLRYLVGDIVTLSRTPCPHLRPARASACVATPRRTGNLVKCRGMLVNTDVILDTLSAMARWPNSRSCSRAAVRQGTWSGP